MFGSFKKNKTRLYGIISIVAIVVFISSCEKEDAEDGSGNTIEKGLELSTIAVTDISLYTASSGGIITSNGNSIITESGVCWSTDSMPTFEDNRTLDMVVGGQFSSSLTSLTSNTTYHVRAYATINEGTVYGNELSFTTSQIGSGPCEPGTMSVTDIDGNTYGVISIGNQCWMQENLRTSRYRNGDSVAFKIGYEAWAGTQNTKEGGYCYYENKAGYEFVYGKWYNWYAANDNRGLCPEGWHLPSDAEWKQLIEDIGGSANAASLRSTGNTTDGTGLWRAPNAATNKSGFTGLPSGQRYYKDGSYSLLDRTARWWGSTFHSSVPDIAFNVGVGHTSSQILYTSWNKSYGLCVRCVKD